MTLYGRIEKAILEVEGGYGAAGVLQGFKAEIDMADEDSVWMGFLEMAGIDNSEAYEYAIQLRNEAGEAEEGAT
jgi:hypothetical protein